MVLPYIPALSKTNVLLASASPRRAELLQQIGLQFTVKPSSFDETLPKSSFDSSVGYTIETARQKALDIARQDTAADLIISADTIVEVDGEILEKPQDPSEARQMLTRLSGRTHQVHTGVALLVPRSTANGLPSAEGGSITTFSTTTNVEFASLDSSTIDSYIASGEPFGKAGGYGIQGSAALFVRRLEGDYFNVVGFPLYDFGVHVTRLIQEGVLPLP
eukprot:jgi/Botrbrau1/22410/Bobra.0091s0015.1